MLYSLGKWFDEANASIRDKPLEVSISKSIFIHFVRDTGIAIKQSRALYKNLEILEKKKLISYDNKELKLTPRGKKHYAEIDKRISPYIVLTQLFSKKDLLSHTRKIQTIFK